MLTKDLTAEYDRLLNNLLRANSVGELQNFRRCKEKELNFFLKRIENILEQNQSKISQNKNILKSACESLKILDGKINFKLTYNDYTKLYRIRVEKTTNEIQKEKSLVAAKKICIENKQRQIAKLEGENKELAEFQSTVVNQFENLEHHQEVKRNARRRGGLTLARIERFRLFKANRQLAGDECGVCFNEIKLRAQMVRLDCGHSFCLSCVDTWFEKANTCPNCRRQY